MNINRLKINSNRFILTNIIQIQFRGIVLFEEVGSLLFEKLFKYSNEQ